MRKETRKEKRLKGLSYLPVIIVALDLLRKWWVRREGVYVVNSGIAWGWLSGSNGWWISIVTLVVLVVWGWKWKRAEEKWLWWGGVGNLVDRLVWGGVTDYIHIPGLGLWFNGADLLISMAMLALIINLGKDGQGRTENTI